MSEQHTQSGQLAQSGQLTQIESEQLTQSEQVIQVRDEQLAQPESGIILLRKEAGLTSFTSLGAIKKSLKKNFGYLPKLGHTGTLDKFATGLLVLLYGSYTRLCPYFTALDKTYRAEILFGVETTSLDPEGDICKRAAPPTREALEKILPQFTGTIMQAPPAYSAIRIDGQRASDRVRAGEEITMEARPITIYQLTLEHFEKDRARLFVHCSSGTYIRSLARDIALALGSVAHLTALERLSVGPFNLHSATLAENFTFDNVKQFTQACAASLGFTSYTVDARLEKRIRHGAQVANNELTQQAKGVLALFNQHNEFIAMVNNEAVTLKYLLVLA